MKVNPKIIIITKILITLFFNNQCFSQKGVGLFRVDNVKMLNSTLICRKYYDRDSISKSVDTFYIQVSKKVNIKNTEYYNLIWGDKD